MREDGGGIARYVEWAGFVVYNTYTGGKELVCAGSTWGCPPGEERNVFMDEKINFCRGGGCTAKLGPGVLERVLSRIPDGPRDPNLLVGYDSRDDGACYRITDDVAAVQTLDFFPPMVDDPYTFGQIAAANAMSDVYAMGGRVVTALNIVCFPEKMSLDILGQIMLCGADKVHEAGASLAGGHSIADDGVKYGLSVMGLVNPKQIWTNTGAQAGDALVLTKALGVGIICTANRVGEASPEAMAAAVRSMTTLNMYASECLHRYPVHACTDVTGFSFLGHLLEMMNGAGLSCVVGAAAVPVIPEALGYAGEFLLTAAAQRNRNHAGDSVRFENVSFAMQEVLFDPQTSGGLLAALPAANADALVDELREDGLDASIVGMVYERTDAAVTVRGAVS